MRSYITVIALVAVLAFAPQAYAQLLDASESSSLLVEGSTQVNRNGEALIDVTRESMTEANADATADAGANSEAITVHEADASFDESSGTLSYSADTDLTLQGDASATAGGSVESATGGSVNGNEVGGETLGTGDLSTGDQGTGLNESFEINESDSITVVP